MGLDIRLPLGLMFTILGAILAGHGLLSDGGIYARSLGINVNLWWGVVMLVFGGLMLALARRRSAAMRPSEQSREGAMIEELEKARGLEAARNERT